MAIIMGKGCLEAIYGLMGWKGLNIQSLNFHIRSSEVGSKSHLNTIFFFVKFLTKMEWDVVLRKLD